MTDEEQNWNIQMSSLLVYGITSSFEDRVTVFDGYTCMHVYVYDCMCMCVSRCVVDEQLTVYVFVRVCVCVCVSRYVGDEHLTVCICIYYIYI